ncbi:hypothetical protein CsatB_003472 [Cannabis sativa]
MVAGIIRRCSTSLATSLSYKDAWSAVLCKLNRISRIAVDCDELWNEANKGQQKRRALSELLKLLESTGLSRHKPVFTEFVAEWAATTEDYFKSVASVLLLQQICLNCHKDITRDQVCSPL